MGRDKRHLPIDGVPLLRRVVDAITPLVDDLHVIVADEDDRVQVSDLVPTVSVEVDLRPGQGPLAATETALTVAAHDAVLVVATDHPHLSLPVLGLLIDRFLATPGCPALTLATDQGPEPLIGIYQRAARAAVTELLEGGERRARALLEALGAAQLEPARWRPLDTRGLTAFDLDTPADLARLADHDADHSRDRVAQREVITIRRGQATRTLDHLIDEEPLEIRAHGPGQAPTTVVTTMRTRGHDEDLAAGWLFGEGLLQPGGIADITAGEVVALARPEDQLTVRLHHALDVDAAAERHTVATASCGVCGRAAIEELAARATPTSLDVPAGGPVPFPLIAQLPDRLRDAQQLFATTGAIHATGLFTTTGAPVTIREDVGRHNALDAAIGAHVRHGTLPLHDLIAVLSGRVGFELVAKAAMAGIPIIVAVGAPTALAARTAEQLGQTLVGFVRGGGGNVYTHPDRLDLVSCRDG